jgi:molybdenum cofactor guanylyltransferase
MSKPCLGVVLAGGRSRRMGCDKSLLLWEGRPLLVHALARFAEAGIEDTAVSGPYAGFDAIPDLHPGEGPLAGIFAVADARPGYRLLIVPVDMPRLPASWLKALLGAMPNVSALHFDATDSIRILLASWLTDPSGPRALRQLLREIGARSIEPPGMINDAFENANSLTDWLRISK